MPNVWDEPVTTVGEMMSLIDDYASYSENAVVGPSREQVLHQLRKFFMPNDYCPINPTPYPVHVPNGIYDYKLQMQRVEIWDNKIVWALRFELIEAEQPMILPAGPSPVIPAWGTYPDLPEVPA